MVPVAYDDPDAVALVAALERDLDERYQDLDADMEADPALLGVEPADVAPPVGAFVVARLDGLPVGCGALRALPGRRDVGEIKRMYVAPAARHRGVARALLAALEVEARRCGYRHLVLETGTRQPEAMALYASSDWQPTERYGAYRAYESSRCYTKDLGAAHGPG